MHDNMAAQHVPGPESDEEPEEGSESASKVIAVDELDGPDDNSEDADARNLSRQAASK